MSASADDRPLFLELAALLPPELAEDAVDAWNIGEQEASLACLTNIFAGSQTPISELGRAQIAVLAESWSCLCPVLPILASCRSADVEPIPLALIEGTDSGTATEAELGHLIGEDHPLSGFAIVAWIACRRCDDALVRVHEIEPWGYPSLLTMQYAIIQPISRSVPTASSAPTMWTSGDGASALAALDTTHHR